MSLSKPPVNKAAAMELYRARRDRTVVIRLPRKQFGYKRCEVVAAVSSSVSRVKIAGIGQLENSLRWEVVFEDEESRNMFMRSQQSHVFDGQQAVVECLTRTTRQLRIRRIPMCVPNEFIAEQLMKFNVKVRQITFEIDRVDSLPTNTRLLHIDADDWDDVPDTMPWSFDGFRGVALLSLQGRPPRCYRCTERGHMFFNCPHPYCKRCHRVGHEESDECYRLSYAQRVSGVASRTATEMEYDEDEANDVEEDNRESNVNERQEQTEPSVNWFEQTEAPTAVTSELQSVETIQPVLPQPASSAEANSESEMSEDGHDGDDGDSSAGEPQNTTVESVDADGFQKPSSQVRRQIRTKKRAARSGSGGSSDTTAKKSKVPGPDTGTDTQTTPRTSTRQSVSETTEEGLDPTSGRSHSRSRIPTSGRRHSTLGGDGGH